MTNDNTASYTCIGATVFAGVAAIIATLIYLGGFKDTKNTIDIETYYMKSVSGLSVGSAVNMRGVKIGEVSEIGFVGEHYTVTGPDNMRIYVRMTFPGDMLRAYEDEGLSAGQLLDRAISKGLRATVTASGITGLSRIELDMKPDVPPPQISWTPKGYYIPSATSLLDNFSDSATKVMNQINKMDITAVWSNLNATVESLAHASDRALTILEARQADMDDLVGNAVEISAAIKDLSADLKRNPSLILRERAVNALPETEQ